MPKLIDFKMILTNIPQLLQYLPITLAIVILSMIVGLVFALIIALVRLNKIPVLTQLFTLLVSFVRGTPLLVQLYLSYYGVPIALKYWNYYNHTNYNINNLPAFLFVFVAFAINEAAYNSENIRGALLSVDRGEIEAAQSLGMTGGQILRRITIPEALVVALPTLGNQFISLIKGTSLAFVAGVIEMTAEGQIIAGRNFRYFEVYLSLAIIYWALTVITEVIIRFVEKRLNKFRTVQKVVEINDTLEDNALPIKRSLQVLETETK
ncbi:amino acid ABC transporter permease [Loigolactobacillus coryniformis]|jgi:polar amino acid transport system permease protein|uniref:Polar amino acid ABC transporter permease n=1 Tax=Loigolactobacillus coryniformis subsp. coryniformis KCTC 3167 = DSM 20001 TaxID=913848 RepID=A0A0R1F8X3_9LACO|nr:amino acid ABC transporter permease [Loigolactobacillus coryniformis]MDT3390983.1 amino acid ABC transporter permease [Bacillota bacterium]OEH90782.1 amino acid ABC transporter permease [Loigolactobacillus coryniformis subsp. coryniformis]RRG05941.1 MAG: amino acid ABC transporter permease [Lactobacillus sp.]ATO56415.1 amino acid ABC transporter permease [Loigolactobacillus coryniformis subsp. coryniformis KCTC 3167 = DSM 20001]KRK15642.1 polar amino acid ABC transporter permease [Loigolact